MTENATSPSLQTVTFAVEGMSCGNCVRHIGNALQEAFGELEHQVDLGAHRMTVTFDPAKQSVEAIAAVMDEEGYPVTPL
jgi:Cu+-exporting ATPase